MLIELILIVVSFIFIVLMILFRGTEFAYAKDSSVLLDKTDRKLSKLFFLFFRNYKKINRLIVSKIKNTPHLIAELLNKLFFNLYKKTRNIIKGNKNINKEKGAVSLYLRNIEKKSSEVLNK